MERDTHYTHHRRIISGETLTVWVIDENQKPLPAAQLGGRETVLVAGKPAQARFASVQ